MEEVRDVRDECDLTELEAEMVNRAIEVYPGALGYSPARDPHFIAKELVAEGRLERLEILDALDPDPERFIEGLITYRLTDKHAEHIRRGAAEGADSARWN